MKVIKSVQVTWNWTGDSDLIKGFQVAITPSSENPNTKIISIAKIGAGFTSYTFDQLILDDTVTYSAWVQALYAGVDSSWVSTGNISVSDDGNATIATTVAVDAAALEAENNAKAYADSLKTLIDSDILDLQNQVDGVAGAWFYAYIPTLANEPAVNWTTDEEKSIHVDDVFYNTATGYAYHFIYNGTYSWERIVDQDVVTALANASTAQDTADSKMRIFGIQPVPPYDTGDLWSGGPTGDLKKCIIAKTSGQSFSESDWELASKYTEGAPSGTYVGTILAETVESVTGSQAKADAAQSAAQTYTDAQALAAETTAKAYADGIVTVAEQSAIDTANAYTDAAKTAAETAAAAYADGVADAAELAAIAAAEAYANARKVEALAYADGIVSDEEARAIADAQAKADAAQAAAEAAAQLYTESWSEEGADVTAKNVLVTNPNFEVGLKYWSTSYNGETVPDNLTGNIVAAGEWGGKVAEITGEKWIFYGKAVPVNTSKVYKGRFRVRQTVDPTVGQAKVYAGLATLDSTYKNITGGAGTHRYFITSSQPITVASGWHQYEGRITGVGDLTNNFREGTAYVRPMFIVNYAGGNGTVQVDGLEFYEDIPATNGIADGADVTNYTSIEADAQARSDAAQSAAESYAAAQATAAQVAAEAYADSVATDAENAAIAAAEAYANLKKTEALAYADGIVSGEEARAIADATAKANAAEAAAKAYVDANFVTSITYGTDLAEIQSQIDGNITTWFYDGSPTLANLPASDWATTDIKNQHLGDIYYDNVTGYAYRFKVDTGIYSWIRITDSDITAAIAAASTAQDTADQKRRVFVVQPTTPYDLGDLWDTGSNIKRCTTAKISSQSYNSADWTLVATVGAPAGTYVGSTLAETVESNSSTAISKLTDMASDSKLTPLEKQATKKEWDSIVAEKAIIEAQATQYGITTEKTAYIGAYDTLNTYITPLLASLSTTSDIVSITFRTNFVNYYDTKAAVIKAITDAAKVLADNAATTASWTGVTGTGKPADNATVGATWGTNITSQPTDAEILNSQQQYDAIQGTKPPADADKTVTAFETGFTGNSGGITMGSTSVIKSSNFVEGSSGWIIRGDGTSEFAAADIRGQLTASQISVTSLSALSADLGTVTAGAISGATVTGSTIQTNTSVTTTGGIKIVGDTLYVYDDSGNLRVKLGDLS